MDNTQTEKKKEMPFLSLVAYFIVTMGLGITSILTLAVEPFCMDFNLLCGAGFFTLVAIGIGISTTIVLAGVLMMYFASKA